MRILYLDDHPLQLTIAREWLESDGHTFHGFHQGTEALKALQRDSLEPIDFHGRDLGIDDLRANDPRYGRASRGSGVVSGSSDPSYPVPGKGL
jgi:CheY-like chemotaxis protein